MLTITANNVNDAYRGGMALLHQTGQRAESRNGPVLVAPYPVTTRYLNPTQRVLFDAQRDANPFFHLFEALWMLDGRNDVKTLRQFVPSFGQFSDDGQTLHGAYGHRWRNFDVSDSSSFIGLDQLQAIVRMLRANPRDRRIVLQIWDARQDLEARSQDIPCNDLVKFRVVDGRLDMYVFCRSNDIIFGCYGANAVHFSMLQEYIAQCAELPVGVYEQISCDFHAYLENPYFWSTYFPPAAPFIDLYYADARPLSLVGNPRTFDAELNQVMALVENERFAGAELGPLDNPFFVQVAQPMYRAHRLLKAGMTVEEARTATDFLSAESQKFADRTGNFNDWLLAGTRWLMRRVQMRTEAGR